MAVKLVQRGDCMSMIFGFPRGLIFEPMLAMHCEFDVVLGAVSVSVMK